LAAKIVRLSPKLRSYVTIRESAKELHCPRLSTSYKALGSDASTAFGKNPALTIFDELGQVIGPRDALFEAMSTAGAAQPNPLTIIISTQAPTDTDLLSILIDDALTGQDPTTVLRFDTAPVDADPFAEETIELANPAFEVFQNKTEILAQRDDARRMPSRESAFRNLILNQRIEAEPQFLSEAVWDACSAEPVDIAGREIFAGLDLSEVNDLTALTLVYRDPTNGEVSAHLTFWLPEEGLLAKAGHDKQPYDLWRRQGYLQTTPGATVSYEYVAKYLYAKVFAKHRVIKLAFDAWNFRHLRPWLVVAGFNETTLNQRFLEFGQGRKSMTPALRELQSLILGRKLRHGGNPILDWNAANCRTEGVDASNRKLSKQKSRGRIDGMIALTIAIGHFREALRHSMSALSFPDDVRRDLLKPSPGLRHLPGGWDKFRTRISRNAAAALVVAVRI
jgi:phage terminase large subunit-like protein